MYNIDIDGEIRNMCDGSTPPLVIRKEDAGKMIKCPLSSCNCDVMFNFYKERI